MDELKSTLDKPAADGDPFRVSAYQALSRLVAAMQQVITGVSPNKGNAAELARILGIPHKAAWQVYKMAEASNPLAAANFIPGKKPTLDLIAAARAKGIDESATGELADAFNAYEQLVRKLAGDRGKFIAMLGADSSTEDDTADADRYHRSLAFKSYSYFYGMYADMSLDLEFLYEAEPGTRTEVDLRTVAGMCRLRPDAQYVMERHKWSPTSTFSNMSERIPLDVASFRAHGVPVIPAFCSRPLPTVIAAYSPDTRELRVEWGDNQVGPNNVVKLTTATVSTTTYVPKNDGLEHGSRFSVKVGYPVKLLAKVWLIYMPGKKLLDPRVKTYLDSSTSLSSEDRDLAPKLRMKEGFQRFPAGSWSDLPPAFAGISEQIMYVCATMKWDPADFTIFTLSVEYPLTNSVLLGEIPWI